LSSLFAAAFAFALLLFVTPRASIHLVRRAIELNVLTPFRILFRFCTDIFAFRHLIRSAAFATASLFAAALALFDAVANFSTSAAAAALAASLFLILLFAFATARLFAAALALLDAVANFSTSAAAALAALASLAAASLALLALLAFLDAKIAFLDAFTIFATAFPILLLYAGVMLFLGSVISLCRLAFLFNF
jgi:hypothetical protein